MVEGFYDVDQVSLHSPLNLQQSVDAEAEGWGKIWQTGACGSGPKWPSDMGVSLPETSILAFRGACLTFPAQVGLGWDKCHPRAIARCSDEVLQLLLSLFILAEATGNWFSTVGVVLVVLIPKSDGGKQEAHRTFPLPHSYLDEVWARSCPAMGGPQ